MTRPRLLACPSRELVRGQRPACDPGEELVCPRCGLTADELREIWGDKEVDFIILDEIAGDTLTERKEVRDAG